MTGRKQFDVAVALTAAMNTFWDHGYEGTSLAMLTQATGLGRGSLYSTFGPKEDLFRRCLKRYGDLYAADYERALQDPDPVEAIRGFYASMLRRMLDPEVPDGCLVAQAASMATSLDEAARIDVESAVDKQRSSVRARFERAGMPASRSQALAEYVVAVRQSLAVLQRSGRTEDQIRTVVDLTCTTVAAACGRPEAVSVPA